MLLWKRYDNNKMAAMRYYVLHLQQYSHRLNLFFYSYNICNEFTRSINKFVDIQRMTASVV